MSGGSLADAERNASYESMFNAGSGLVNAVASDILENFPLAMLDHNNAFFNAFAPAENACGTGN